MLSIVVTIHPEGWDEVNEEFVPAETITLKLEHSLLSLSKWESKWCKPFLTKEQKTLEETIDYIKCMTITKKVDPEIYNLLNINNINEVNAYIEAPMTATTVNDSGKPSKEQITSELIYYWMIALQIPFDCEKWHLNRLLTLIRVCNKKNQPPKKQNKQSRQATMNQYAALNKARRAKLNSKG